MNKHTVKYVHDINVFEDDYSKHLVNMANFIVNKCPYPLPFFFSIPAVILKGSWENSAKLKTILRIRIKKIVSEFIYVGKTHWLTCQSRTNSIGAVTRDLLPSLLLREIGVVRVTGLFQDKFTNEKNPWLRQKEERNRPWHLRWNSWGFSVPKASRGEQQVVTFAHASSLMASTCWREIVMAESRSEALSREIFLHTQSTTDMSYRLDTLAKPCWSVMYGRRTI